MQLPPSHYNISLKFNSVNELDRMEITFWEAAAAAAAKRRRKGGNVGSGQFIFAARRTAKVFTPEKADQLE
jgi:hypothetical protein